MIFQSHTSTAHASRCRQTTVDYIPPPHHGPNRRHSCHLGTVPVHAPDLVGRVRPQRVRYRATPAAIPQVPAAIATGGAHGPRRAGEWSSRPRPPRAHLAHSEPRGRLGIFRREIGGFRGTQTVCRRGSRMSRGVSYRRTGNVNKRSLSKLE